MFWWNKQRNKKHEKRRRRWIPHFLSPHYKTIFWWCSHPFSPLPSACFLPWHLLFAWLLTMFADPTAQNDELLKGKSNLISKPNFSVSTRLLYCLCSWLTIYFCVKLFAISLCCSPPCPGGVLLTRSDGSPESLACSWNPAPDSVWSPDVFPLISSSTVNASHHLQVTLASLSHTQSSLKVTKSHGWKKSLEIISLISLPHAWETK